MKISKLKTDTTSRENKRGKACIKNYIYVCNGNVWKWKKVSGAKPGRRNWQRTDENHCMAASTCESKKKENFATIQLLVVLDGLERFK